MDGRLNEAQRTPSTDKPWDLVRQPPDDRGRITFNAVIPDLAPGDHWAMWGAARDGARTVLTRVQVGAIALLVLPAAVLVGTSPRAGLIVCIAVVTTLYLVTGMHKIWLIIRGELADSRSGPGPPLPAADELPVYTVLVPLFREGRILPALVERLKLLDYPPERLQVLLLIESDDFQTQSAASNGASQIWTALHGRQDWQSHFVLRETSGTTRIYSRRTALARDPQKRAVPAGEYRTPQARCPRCWHESVATGEARPVRPR